MFDALSLAAAASMLTLPMDLAALDGAIARCDREAVLPVFTEEPQRRSAFLTAAYEEQAAISTERALVAEKRRALREAAPRAPTAKATPPQPGESDQELALAQLAIEDRQRALDDRRRLETLRQDAVEVKRQFFLARCPTRKRSD